MENVYTVVVTDDEGAETYRTIKVMAHPATSRADEVTIALDYARHDALEEGRRVAEVPIDWQDTAETAITRVEELTACIQGIAECRQERFDGWEYYNADDVDALLTQYGF